MSILDFKEELTIGALKKQLSEIDSLYDDVVITGYTGSINGYEKGDKNAKKINEYNNLQFRLLTESGRLVSTTKVEEVRAFFHMVLNIEELQKKKREL